MRALFRHIGRFRRNKSANVAVIFTIAAVPIMTFVGSAVDYSRATATRSKLQSAVDAASVGSVTKTSPAFIAAGTMTADGPIAAGVTDATNIFNANMNGVPGYTLSNMTATVNKSGGTVTSTVSFTATVSTTFLNVIGKTSMTVNGTSTATTTMPLYIDFYLLLDNSPSMGVGATPADVTKMVNNTSDQCAFACHDLNNTNNYYKLAKTLGVTTRIDVLRTATQSLMDTAAQDADLFEPVSDGDLRFRRRGEYSRAESPVCAIVQPVERQSAAGNIDLMTVNGQNDNNDQDTQFTSVIPAINGVITAPGAGTTSAPLKYLFFVSDGVADEYNPSSCIKSTTSSGALPIADQHRALHHHQEPRHQDRRVVHHLPRRCRPTPGTIPGYRRSTPGLTDRRGTAR